MKLMLDLERVGDLVLSFAERCAIVRNQPKQKSTACDHLSPFPR
jgi:hypothetical protein